MNNLLHITETDFARHFKHVQTAVTIGNFDGQHLGHRLLFDSILNASEKDGLSSVIFSFRPHPVIFLKKNPDFKLITSYDERLASISNTGVEYFIEYPFTSEFAASSPTIFLDMIIDGLNCRQLFLGEGYRFGKDRKGSLEDYADYAAHKGTQITTLRNLEYGGVKISSSIIRECILAKDFYGARRLMGQPYRVYAKSWDHKTANGTQACAGFSMMIPPEEKLLPPSGKYFAEITAGGVKAKREVTIDNNLRILKCVDGIEWLHTPSDIIVEFLKAAVDRAGNLC